MKDKRMLYMATLVMGGIVLIIILIVIFTKIFTGRMSFEKIESKMESAAISYLATREDELPKNNGNTITLSVDSLVSAKKMKALEKIVPKGSSCTGKVIVTNNGGNYLYSPILDCGNDYKSEKLHDVITSADKIVVEGDGLYAKENGYIFRGENVNNLVKIDDRLWAIIDIDAEGYLRLINVNNKTKTRLVWDDRYNLEEKGYVGINDYSVSRLKDYLKELEIVQDYFTDEAKSYLASRKWCIGKRSDSNKSINNDEECSVMSDEQLFGLPYVSDAFMASIDKNCENLDDESCDNYNYFSSYAISSWTLTGVKESTSKAYYVVGSTYIPTKTSTIKNIVPTIYLSNNVMYASGNGSFDDPYILK